MGDLKRSRYCDRYSAPVVDLAHSIRSVDL